ncbi:MAG: DUF2219 family protein [Flavobacteriaceae bacterium TMED120]|nr:MAG: DUF2219 family protein [Flavobacteriaceae bacterium TMED120]
MRSQAFFLFLYWLCFTGWSQSQLTLSVDNDLYFKTDYYYSSGLFLSHGKEIQKDSSRLERHFSEWKLGQMIYNPSKRYATELESLDYPFSGYLFLRHQKEKIILNKRGYQYTIELGVSGDASLAKAAQNLYHEWILNLPPLSWTAAMPQQFHLGVGGNYFQSLALGDYLALVPDVRGTLSTFQTRAALRLGLVVGSTAKIPFDFSPLLNAQKGWGLYVAWQQEYVAHDFPLEGGLFNDAAVFTMQPNRGRDRLECGAVVHNRDWKIQASYYSSSQDTPGQRHPRHKYLNIQISRFF